MASTGSLPNISNGRAEAERPAASEKDLDLIRSVCQIVARQFYSDQHVIVIDILSRYLVMPADILAGSLGVPIKDLLQISNQLMRDRLIGVFKRGEVRETSTATSVFTRNTIRNYFYLDRKVFLDVIKWRMMKMRSQIDSVLRNELDNKGYMCPRCGKSYSTLDAAALLDPVTHLTFICDVPGCGSELVDNEDAEDVRRSKDRLKRFNEQCGPILDRLRQIDAVTLPSFDIPTEISRIGDSDAWKLRARQRIDPNATMKDIREAQGQARPAGFVEIDMVSNDPILEEARRQQREKEAERQRQENAMPIWYKTTQDPNDPRRIKEEEERARVETRGAGAEKGEKSTTAGLQDDYYANYASMAQEAEDENDLEEEMEFEDVAVDDSATPSGPSTAHTPNAAGKRSREDSISFEGSGLKAKKTKAEIENKAEEDDEEELEFEDVA